MLENNSELPSFSKSKDITDNIQIKSDEQMVEMATEQIANLLWRQWIFNRDSTKDYAKRKPLSE